MQPPNPDTVSQLVPTLGVYGTLVLLIFGQVMQYLRNRDVSLRDVRDDLAELRTSLRSDVEAVRADVADVRSDVFGLKRACMHCDDGQPPDPGTLVVDGLVAGGG